MKKSRVFSLVLVLVFLLTIFVPVTAMAISKSKTVTKTQAIFSKWGGYAKDSFVWECSNGKVISSSASQASSPILIIYSVTPRRITCTARTAYYHEYQSVYRLNAGNKLISEFLSNLLGVKVPTGLLGYKEITATYRLNGDGTFKYVKVSW